MGTATLYDWIKGGSLWKNNFAQHNRERLDDDLICKFDLMSEISFWFFFLISAGSESPGIMYAAEFSLKKIKKVKYPT